MAMAMTKAPSIFASTALLRVCRKIDERILRKAAYKLLKKGFAITPAQVEAVKAKKSQRKLPNEHVWQAACNEAAEEIVWGTVFGFNALAKELECYVHD
jgi:hypothetical protein